MVAHSILTTQAVICEFYIQFKTKADLYHKLNKDLDTISILKLTRKVGSLGEF